MSAEGRGPGTEPGAMERLINERLIRKFEEDISKLEEEHQKIGVVENPVNNDGFLSERFLRKQQMFFAFKERERRLASLKEDLRKTKARQETKK